MDIIYGYEILFDNHTPSSNKYYQIEENISLLSDDIFILYLNNNQYREVSITSDKSFKSLHPNQNIFFHIKDVISFHFQLKSNKIYYKYYKYGNQELLKYWLFHTFLPIVLTLENEYYYIHAGAVEVENKPILFIANSFGGKSTLTDFFIKRNHTLISDDKVATYIKDENIYSVPSYSYHRPYRKVEDLGIYVENFAKEVKPIYKIYNLIKSDKDVDISINEIIGIKKFTALRYATDIDLQVNKESRFSILSSIANNIRIYDITIPWDLDRLEEVYQTIIEHNKKG
jgi:hypothetical protein